jgi:hypothetical protein
MSNRRTTAERIDAQKERMEQMQNEMKRLKRQQSAEERKARNHRICVRGGHIEKILPDTIGLSDARFFTFLEKTVANDFGKKILVTLKAEQDKEDAKNGKAKAEDVGDASDHSATVAAAQGGSEPTSKSAVPTPGNDASATPKPAQTSAAPIGADGSRTGDGGATQGA